jgi:peptide/nickel transport system substrate-binding protein
MPKKLNRREFLVKAGAFAALAAPGGLALDACSQVVSSSVKKPTTIRVGWNIEPDTMNPLTTYSTEAIEVQNLVYDALIEYDLNLRPVPGLATSWSYSPDGKSITYKLRPGVSWHDGQPFSSADAQFSFQYIKAFGPSNYSQWVDNLVSADATDSSTVVVNFSAPQAFNPGLTLPMLPKHVWEKLSRAEVEKYTNPKMIGTGPYKFVDWKLGQSIEVTRNDDWWGPKPSAENITWVLFQNNDIMAEALRTSEVDIIIEIPPTIFVGLEGVSNVNTVSPEGFSFHHIGMNVSDNPKSGGNPLLKDRTIRLALSYAVSRQQLCDVAMAGLATPGSVLLTPSFGEYFLDIPPDQQYDNNPEKAKALLDAAGYIDRDGSGIRSSPDGKPLSFRLIAITTTPVDVEAAQLFRDAAAKVGIELNFSALDANTLGSIVYNSAAPNWDIFVWGWDELNDPDYMLSVELCNEIGSNNDSYYCSSHYNQLYQEQATELDPDMRVALVHETQQYFYDYASYIIMWYQRKLQAYRTDKLDHHQGRYHPQLHTSELSERTPGLTGAAGSRGDRLLCSNLNTWPARSCG